MAYTYPKDFSRPVLALAVLGEKSARQGQWPDYLKLGLTSEHISELIHILDEIDTFMPEDAGNEPEVYAPIHAWRALGQLRAEVAVPALVRVMVWNEEAETDWVMEEIPDVMGMIGPAGIPALRDYLLRPEKLEWASVTVAHCLAEVGQRHPGQRDQCVEALQSGLEQYAANGEIINAHLISYLVDLKAVEAAPLVERAYQADAVDLSVLGDFEDFQIELGLLEKRLTPPPEFFWARESQAAWGAYREAERRQRENDKKEKKKQKQAKKARKRNKKK